MRRIPEPDLMNKPEQVHAYANADFAEAHNMFVELFRGHFSTIPNNGTMLDLGCGAADITIRMAQAFPGYKILAVDGADNMLEYAHTAIEKNSLQNRIQLQQAYLPATGLGDRFDIIFSNSLLHHLSDPATLWQSIKHYSLPGTLVFIMDLLRPESVEAARALVTEYAGNEPAILQKDFYNSLLAAYRTDEISDQLENCGLENLSIEIVSDRHFIVFGSLQKPKTNLQPRSTQRKNSKKLRVLRDPRG
jgi:2-polyprenyl-3-methyl-5-hydroxy-6-metoxy-1,4-benzoquinol methylase